MAISVRYMEYKQARFNMRVPAWMVVNAMHYTDDLIAKLSDTRRVIG